MGCAALLQIFAGCSADEPERDSTRKYAVVGVLGAGRLKRQQVIEVESGDTVVVDIDGDETTSVERKDNFQKSCPASHLR